MITSILILLTITFTVIGNLFLKMGVMTDGISDIWPLSFLNIKVFIGLVCFACSVLFYAALLQRLPLNVAQSIFSIQFVAVILAAKIILGEPISLTTWIGILLVACGLIVIGLSISQ